MHAASVSVRVMRVMEAGVRMQESTRQMCVVRRKSGTDGARTGIIRSDDSESSGNCNVIVHENVRRKERQTATLARSGDNAYGDVCTQN